MKKRVLHVLWDGGLGGAQQYVLKLAQAQQASLEPAICMMQDEGKIIHAGRFTGLCRALGLQRGFQIRRALKLSALVKEFDPQVIHCHCDSPSVFLQLPLLRKRRLIYTEHGDSMLRTERKGATGLIWRLLGRYWDHVIFNSRFTQQVFLKSCPWMDTVGSVLPNPLFECPDADPVPKQKGRIGFFGRLVPHKGLDVLLEALPRVCGEFEAVDVRVFGTGEAEEALRKQADRLGIAEHVTFMGMTTDSLKEMAACEVVAMPSRLEPFGLVALEAQSVGVPVVGFSGHGVEEIVVNEETGLLVVPQDPDAFSDALIRLLGHPELRQNLGAAAKDRAGTLFSVDRHLHELHQRYEG